MGEVAFIYVLLIKVSYSLYRKITTNKTVLICTLFNEGAVYLPVRCTNRKTSLVCFSTHSSSLALETVTCITSLVIQNFNKS